MRGPARANRRNSHIAVTLVLGAVPDLGPVHDWRPTSAGSGSHGQRPKGDLSRYLSGEIIQSVWNDMLLPPATRHDGPPSSPTRCPSRKASTARECPLGGGDLAQSADGPSVAPVKLRRRCIASGLESSMGTCEAPPVLRQGCFEIDGCLVGKDLLLSCGEALEGNADYVGGVVLGYVDVGHHVGVGAGEEK